MSEELSNRDHLLDLLIEADGICSIILSREGGLLFDQTLEDLSVLVDRLRPVTDAIIRERRDQHSFESEPGQHPDFCRICMKHRSAHVSGLLAKLEEARRRAGPA